MHTPRLAMAGLALVASTFTMISCSSDDNTPTNTGVGGTSVGANTLPSAETTVVETTSP